MRGNEDTYDTAQVCLNGHIATSSFHDCPQFRKKFCDRCGQATVTACSACKAEIRGSYRGSMSTRKHQAPGYCHECGKPYPWTKTRLDAARLLTDEIAELDDSEKTLLKASIDELIADTPSTPLAVVRFKKYAAKGGRELAQGLKDILVDMVSETVRKAIWGA
jgi:hypothetical protein